jgi:hypothetical protein
LPYHFEFDATNRILRGRLEGHITDDILKEFYRMVEKYAAQTDPCAGIVDMSAVTALEVSPETIRGLASLAPAMPDASRHRFIVSPSPSVFGMARMFQLLGEKTQPNLHVVHLPEEVWTFLGIQEPQFERMQAV